MKDMLPKVVKGGGIARRVGRLTISNTPVESANDESVNIGEVSGSNVVDRSIEEDNLLDVSNPADSFDASEAVANPDGLVLSRKETDVKESVDDFGKDERLDLDDNELEYESEEYGGDNELGEEEDEEPEEEIEVDNQAWVFADDIGYDTEKLESEDDHEHVDEEEVRHGETVDVEEEEEEHHDVLHERRKHKEFEIFVGDLDEGATEEDLKKVFGHVGEVTEIRIMRNPETKKSKGYAFLRFATVEQAKLAVKELKSPMINGKKCGVTATQDKDTLFIGHICKTWTTEALREKLKHYGVQNMDDMTLVEDSNNVKMNRGYAFLEFSSRLDAMDAHKLLLKKDVMFGLEKPAKVSFADSFLEPEDEITTQLREKLKVEHYCIECVSDERVSRAAYVHNSVYVRYTFFEYNESESEEEQDHELIIVEDSEEDKEPSGNEKPNVVISLDSDSENAAATEEEEEEVTRRVWENQSKRKFWTTTEEEMLKIGVEKFGAEARKNMPWKKILEWGKDVFESTRMPSDLKDKWRRMKRSIERI